MAHLRKIMLEELERRNYAQTTIDCYIRTVEHFSRYFGCSPDRAKVLLALPHRALLLGFICK